MIGACTKTNKVLESSPLKVMRVARIFLSLRNLLLLFLNNKNETGNFVLKLQLVFIGNFLRINCNEQKNPGARIPVFTLERVTLHLIGLD